MNNGRKSIDNIANEVKKGDVLLLTLPACAQTCGGSLEGEDNIAGNYLRADKKNIYLKTLNGEQSYLKEDIDRYEIIKTDRELKLSSELENCVKPLDLLRFIPNKNGDSLIGFVTLYDDERIKLGRCRKFAYEVPEEKELFLRDYIHFEVLQKFLPDPENDGLDEILVSMNLVEAPPGDSN